MSSSRSSKRSVDPELASWMDEAIAYEEGEKCGHGFDFVDGCASCTTLARVSGMLVDAPVNERGPENA